MSKTLRGFDMRQRDNVKRSEESLISAKNQKTGNATPCIKR